MGIRRASLAVAAVAALATLGGCSAGTGQPTPTPTVTASATPTPTQTVDVPLALGQPTDLVTGLRIPWSAVFVDGVALVSERATGHVLEVSSAGAVREMAVIDGVQARGEGGLLGLAVRDDRLYVYSTGPDGNRIQRYPILGTAGSLSLGDGETLLDGLPAGTNHNGGRLAFGPDGMLYAGVGDSGDTDLAQDLGSLGGKILRMTPEGAVPADNPFPGSYVYSYGHRNVQGLAWAADGTMFASEFGQDTWDELNVIVAGGDYGWPIVEGIAGDGDFIDPVQQWTPGEASPSGIAIVGDTIFVANLRGEVLRAVPTARPWERTDLFAGEYGRIRAVIPAPDGSLWLLTGNTDGRGDPRDGDDRILRVTVQGA